MIGVAADSGLACERSRRASGRGPYPRARRRRRVDEADATATKGPDEALCPACATPLALLAPGEATCPAGHGRALDLALARRRLPPEAHAMLDWVVRRAPLGHKPCPVCREPMGHGEVGMPRRATLGWVRKVAIDVDACPACGVVWLDAPALGAL